MNMNEKGDSDNVYFNISDGKSFQHGGAIYIEDADKIKGVNMSISNCFSS